MRMLLLALLISIQAVHAIDSNETIINSTQCDFAVNILTNKTIFFDDFEFKIQVNRTQGNKSEVIIAKEILNPFGDIAKSYQNSTIEITNHRTIDFSPNLRENNAYIIRSEIFPACNDVNKQNNLAIKEFFIVGEKQSEDSEMKIENILDLGNNDKAEFGSSIRVRIYAYRGNTDKQTINIWIEKDNEKITKQSKVNIEEKYSRQTITIPLQLFPNCNLKLKNDTYHVKIEGLDSEDEKPVEVVSSKKNSCETVEKFINKTIFINKTEKVYINITKNTETNLNVSSQGIVVYESKQERSKRSALFFFCGLLILLVIKIKTENGN